MPIHPNVSLDYYKSNCIKKVWYMATTKNSFKAINDQKQVYYYIDFR